MKSEEFKKIVEKNTKKENISKDIAISFLVGGLVGAFGQFCVWIFTSKLHFTLSDAYALTMITIVILASLLTGFGVMDNLMYYAKCGLVVPSTGFANSMTSCAMDYRKEGFIKGIGSNIFKLTGSVILYGVVFGFFVGVLKGVFS